MINLSKGQRGYIHRFGQVRFKGAKIALYANIFKFFGLGKKTFSDVKDAYIRVVNRDTGKEICKYVLAENGAGCDAFHFADLVKNGSEWKFVAVGNGCNGSVDKLRKKYL